MKVRLISLTFFSVLILAAFSVSGPWHAAPLALALKRPSRRRKSSCWTSTAPRRSNSEPYLGLGMPTRMRLSKAGRINGRMNW